jgi:hypothetical protein
MSENMVRKPRPRPVLPNICCSIGAWLKNIAKINCSTNKIEIIFKELRILDLFLTLKLLSRYGRIIRIEQNRIIIFGMINASL